MSKLIVYLDQNVVSNMAKAKFLGDSGLAAKTAPYGSRFDRLSALVENESVICAESMFHMLESENVELAAAVQRVLSRLSFGLYFHTPWDIVMFQAFRAARLFLALPGDEMPPWQDAFTHDPDEALDCRTIQIGAGRVVLRTTWPAMPRTVKPTAYMRDRQAVCGKYLWTDFDARKQQQENAIIDTLFLNPTDVHGLNIIGGLHEYWFLHDLPQNRFHDFLNSSELRACPFVSTLSILSAAINCDPKRTAKPSDAMDTLILATVLPYCDAIAVSADLFGLWQQTKLERTFKARVFSSKESLVKHFDDWLATRDSSTQQRAGTVPVM
ncbi:MAG: hypothetical protein ACYDCG_19505 [Candidatus Acidiferrales bacterium]